MISPILSNLVLDQLDRFVEKELIPGHTRGSRRKTNPPYVALTVAASRARQKGDREQARKLSKQAQTLASRKPCDPNFRRLWYVRYADDFLLGYTGPKSEAVNIKQQISRYLCDRLKLQLSDEKTLITHARDERAKFLGYEVHVHRADHKHDRRGQRCINGSVGLKVPQSVVKSQCKKYMRNNRPVHLPKRLNDNAYGIVALYQSEYSGIVQYYRLAYNLHTLGRVKWVAEQSLTKTLVNKLRTGRREIYRRFKRELTTPEGTYKVLMVTVDRGPKKRPLVAHFGGISLRRNEWATIGEIPTVIWSGRSELLQRLLAKQCELCESKDNIEVHHIRKLADLKGKSPWEKVMAARRRKTLVVCQKCHQQIHSGSYNGRAFR